MFTVQERNKPALSLQAFRLAGQCRWRQMGESSLSTTLTRRWVVTGSTFSLSTTLITRWVGGITLIGFTFHFQTTWVDPRNSRPSPLPSQSNVPNRFLSPTFFLHVSANVKIIFRRHQDDLGPLPEGWEERVHTDGRIFFIDHNTR